MRTMDQAPPTRSGRAPAAPTAQTRGASRPEGAAARDTSAPGHGCVAHAQRRPRSSSATDSEAVVAAREAQDMVPSLGTWSHGVKRPPPRLEKCRGMSTAPHAPCLCSHGASAAAAAAATAAITAAAAAPLAACCLPPPIAAAAAGERRRGVLLSSEATDSEAVVAAREAQDMVPSLGTWSHGVKRPPPRLEKCRGMSTAPHAPCLCSHGASAAAAAAATAAITAAAAAPLAACCLPPPIAAAAAGERRRGVLLSSEGGALSAPMLARCPR